MKRILFILVIILVLLPMGAVFAQESGPIVVGPGDNPLVITGWMGSDAGFKGSLRLSAGGNEAVQFTMKASDLALENGVEKVQRGDINLPTANTKLAPGVPQDFVISIANIPAPGTYRGSIEVYVTGESAPAATIQVELTAKAPELTPDTGQEKLTFNLVNCKPGLDCWLARILLPSDAFQNEWQLKLQNPTRNDSRIESAQVTAVGQNASDQITKEAVSFPAEAVVIPAGTTGTYRMQINRQNISPDHYTGKLKLKLAGREEYTPVDIDWNVRAGALFPTILLIIGILLGRLSKYMTEKGEPLSQAMKLVTDLKLQLQDLNVADQVLLKAQVDKLHRDVVRGRMDAEQAKAAVTLIEQRAEMLKNLRSMEGALKDKLAHPSAQEAMGYIQQARTSIQEANDAAIPELLGKIQKILTDLANSMMSGGEPDKDLMDAAGKAGDAGEAASHAAEASKLTGKEEPAGCLPGLFGRVSDAFVWTTGVSYEVRAQATLWFVRPLLYWVLLIGLIFLGLSSLYISQPAFGSKPFADFAGLVMWGLGSEVAGRTLGNLQFNNPPG
jgi:hypothetical protein